MDGLVTKLRSFYGAGGILKIELMDAGACTLHAEALSILKRVLDIKECRTGMPISSARFIAEFCLKFIQVAVN